MMRDSAGATQITADARIFATGVILWRPQRERSGRKYVIFTQRRGERLSVPGERRDRRERAASASIVAPVVVARGASAGSTVEPCVGIRGDNGKHTAAGYDANSALHPDLQAPDGGH
jgi:hypothetical protein